MKMLVTGAGGQLGHDVCKELRARGVDSLGADLAEFDITDADATSAFIGAYRPDAVIHCSAYTAVDRAEDDLARCEAVNTEGPRNIARACRKTGAKLLYVSTDYVFPGAGERPYEVDDPAGPLGAYGRTKLGGEEAVRGLLERFFIVRTSWVFGKNGNNFVKTMLRLGGERERVGVVCDQVGSPTYTADLAPLLCTMAMGERYGVYHATNEGFCSWAQFAAEIFRLAGLPAVVDPISTSAYPSRAKRPLNSRLSKESLDLAGFSRLPDWRDALRRCLLELGALKDG